MADFKLTLKREDVLQILDALESRAEAWEFTYRYLSGGTDPQDEFMIAEECSYPEEAAAIAKHFRDIVAAINRQIAGQ